MVNSDPTAYIGNVGWDSNSGTIVENIKILLTACGVEESKMPEIMPLSNWKSQLGSGAYVIFGSMKDFNYFQLKAKFLRKIFMPATKPAYIVQKWSEAEKKYKRMMVRIHEVLTDIESEKPEDDRRKITKKNKTQIARGTEVVCTRTFGSFHWLPAGLQAFDAAQRDIATSYALA